MNTRFSKLNTQAYRRNREPRVWFLLSRFPAFRFCRFSSGTARPACVPATRAFTLLELLVVISIIGILAAVALPRISGFAKSNATVSATRQLLDDIALARSLALSTRSDVYMVFVPPVNRWPPGAVQTAPELLDDQYTTYALYSERSVGDQPGAKNPRYLTPWKSLPSGTFIATNKFSGLTLDGVSSFELRPDRPVAFPFATNKPVPMPCIVFMSKGQLDTRDGVGVGRNFGGEIIPLARGSIFYRRGPDGEILANEPLDISENPPGNSRTNSTMWTWVFIDGLTSRAEIKRQEVQ